MKLAIMQPYFFPYLGYFCLIKHTEQFILFDSVQFIRHGWIERNRILKPAEGWQYIAVPLKKHSRETVIKDIKIRIDEEWKEKIMRQLVHYKKAPFFLEVSELMHKAMDIETDSIVLLNANILEKTCAYLGIPLRLNIFSEMNMPIDQIEHAGDWALNISKALGATEYVNPSGGTEILKKNDFDLAGIELKFIQPVLKPYSQNRNTYEQGLSIIDVMMFNSVKDIQIMLNEYQFV